MSTVDRQARSYNCYNCICFLPKEGYWIGVLRSLCSTFNLPKPTLTNMGDAHLIAKSFLRQVQAFWKIAKVNAIYLVVAEVRFFQAPNQR